MLSRDSPHPLIITLPLDPSQIADATSQGGSRLKVRVASGDAVIRPTGSSSLAICLIGSSASAIAGSQATAFTSQHIISNALQESTDSSFRLYSRDTNRGSSQSIAKLQVRAKLTTATTVTGLV